YNDQQNTIRQVIFERANKSGRMTGFTENYVEASATFDPAMIRKISRVRLLEKETDGSINSEPFNY
ncbi:MAG: hypothetical protein J7L96_01840, partial [Bacteroidales bacterium]|nr:hypothetical protein [Bacteroidales bacterium]